MSLKLDAQIIPSGTRFRIFPLPRYAEAPSFAEPELVVLSLPAGSILPGPADDRMFVVDAPNKQPYNQYSFPPYHGEVGSKVQPDQDGHFDHIPVTSREFLLCTMYATVRRVLDIWEDYFGSRIDWHFSVDYERMELIPLINWDNAQSGYGFLEFGYGRSRFGGLDFKKPYCENFDVLAHELGHSIIFSQVGVPRSNASDTGDYGGFHESAGDLVALVALLHFDSIVDHLLSSSRGNLFTVNELNRIGELSASDQIRLAFNYLRMSDVGTEPHQRSEPLTGAFFDIFVEIYQRRLVAAGLISKTLAENSLGPRSESPESVSLQIEFDTAYAVSPGGFKLQLLEARDEFGELLAAVWSNLAADNLSYSDIARVTLEQDSKLNGGINRNGIRASFLWREITVPGTSLLRAAWRVSRLGYGEQPSESLSKTIRKNQVSEAYFSRTLGNESKSSGRIHQLTPNKYAGEFRRIEWKTLQTAVRGKVTALAAPGPCEDPLLQAFLDSGIDAPSVPGAANAEGEFIVLLRAAAEIGPLK